MSSSKQNVVRVCKGKGETDETSTVCPIGDIANGWLLSLKASMSYMIDCPQTRHESREAGAFWYRASSSFEIVLRREYVVSTVSPAFRIWYSGLVHRADSGTPYSMFEAGKRRELV